MKATFTFRYIDHAIATVWRWPTCQSASSIDPYKTIAVGCKLVLVGRSEERLRAIVGEMPNARPLVIAADFTKATEVVRIVKTAIAEFGHVDICLPNAGIYIPADVVDGDADAWDELLTLNINSVFRLVREVLPQMIERRQGDILVTSSISGHRAIQCEPVYSASKHAVQAFVHGVRRQVAKHGVRVGAVAPGMVLNELLGFHDPAAIDAKVATCEGLRSEDVAEAVLFMLTRPPNITIHDLVILPQNQGLSQCSLACPIFFTKRSERLVP